MNDDHLAAYEYDLPRERIAQFPLPVRSDARLLVLHRQANRIDHFHVRDLPEILNSNDLLVFNNSRVIPARLLGRRTNTGGRWEGLFLRRDSPSGIWEILSKTRGRLQPGETITLTDRRAQDGVRLEVVERTPDHNLLVRPLTNQSFLQVLQHHGRVPIPPYIRDGLTVDQDAQTYQTVYARHDGSVAAPTAGLHFTKQLLDQLKTAGIDRAEVTLHVGIGTFRPIEVTNLTEHKMHSEWASLDESAAERINDAAAGGGRRIAVGTTTVRTLETAAVGSNRIRAFAGDCDLFIRPGYQFSAVDGLLTNFHLPKSSLLVLVSAFAGRETIMQAYHEAIAREYRFYSYGDAMLIL